MNDSSTVQLRGSTFRSMVMPVRMRFAPPYADRVSDPSGFAYWWQLMRLVFDLPDPNRFPPLHGFDAASTRVLERYLLTCEELVESTVLSFEGGVSVHVGADGEGKVTPNFPPKESIRGTVALFRQLSSPGEKASYSATRKIIGAAMHTTADALSPQRDEWQRRWNHAHGQLNAHLLTAMADRRALTMQGAHPSVPIAGEGVRPQELISIFQYGDLIHWGQRAASHESLHRDPHHTAFETLNFLLVVTQLSHFYLGYSLLVQAAMGQRALPGVA